MSAPRTRERVTWSVALPEADDGDLLAGPDGRVVVSTRRFLAVVRPPGTVEWLVERPVALLGAPVLLAGGAVSRFEDGAVVTRDGGAVVGNFPVAGPVAAVGDDLLCGDRTPPGPVLRRVGPDGTPRWSVPLVDRLFAAPVVLDDVVVVVDGPLLRGYDHGGTGRWIAGVQGFGPPDGSPVGVADGMIRGAPTPLPDGRLVAEVAERHGYGLVLFDPAAREVVPLRPPIAVRPPLAVVPRGLAALGPAEELERGRWRWMVVLVDPSGTVLWSHRLDAEPIALVPVAPDQVVVVSSPPLGRWEKYQGWFDLSAECVVRCLGADGRPRWRWYPPIPLTYRPAAGPDGSIHVAGPGRLWTLH